MSMQSEFACMALGSLGAEWVGLCLYMRCLCIEACGGYLLPQ